MTTMTNLITLAKKGEFRTIDFVIAARYCKGYDEKKAKHLEEQYFDTYGNPITDKEYHKGQLASASAENSIT